ncbi:conserved hypothetical protein [Paraburkholderia piptadeniae]|uniref:Uncharacterized protein n=1 Tax=Paraburkholderia piptadeniae TaxID=1701573 RepID=A0A1N7RVL0_9BURK|nr:conserved hypothetical protein [Paraburkholderia piptadeniae]
MIAIFHGVAGPDLMGRTFDGRDEVRKGFSLAWETCPLCIVTGRRAFCERRTRRLRIDVPRHQGRRLARRSTRGGRVHFQEWQDSC